MATEVKVPTLGESVTEATVGELLKNVGDAVAVDEPIISLETDKVAVEAPSPVAGVIKEFKVAVGDTVEVEAVIAVIEEGAAPAAKGAEAGRAQEERAEGKQERADTPAPAASSDAAQTLSPAVRRAVLEHGVDPSTIKGTGKDGRLTKEDVIAAAKAKQDGGSAPAAASGVPAAGAGERREERVKMTRMRQTIAKRLKGAQGQCSTADDVQRCRHVRGHGSAQQVQGPVRQEARHPIGLHGLLRQGSMPRVEGRTRGQCLYRGRRDRLSAMSTMSISRSPSRRPTALSCR